MLMGGLQGGLDRGHGSAPDHGHQVRAGIKGHFGFQPADIRCFKIGQNEVVRANFADGPDGFQPGCLAKWGPDFKNIDVRRGFGRHGDGRGQGDKIQGKL